MTQSASMSVRPREPPALPAVGMVQVTSEQVQRMARIIKADADKLAEDRNFTASYQSIMAALLMKMGFDEAGAVYAAKRDKSLHGALVFLKSASFSDCELCCASVPNEELDRNSLLPCKHTACTMCLKVHFQEQVKYGKLPCVSCQSDIPQAENLHLLKRVFGNEYEEFNEKLLTCALEGAKDMKYCVNEKCQELLSVPENLTKLHCPTCKTLGCARCGQKWRNEHEGRTCEEFKKWKSENDPDDPEFQSQALIRKNALVCPSCKTPYFKAKGGCAHFTCPKCKNQFCECCKTKFLRGDECGNQDCRKKGMHGHHPRNCFFYTRDFPIEQLLGLLKEQSISVDEQDPTIPGLKCSVNITNDDFQDSECGVVVHKAGKCIKHYTEMVCDLIAHHNVDILSIMNERQLMQELEKNGKPLPNMPSEMCEGTRLALLQKAVADAVPLQPARN